MKRNADDLKLLRVASQETDSSPLPIRRGILSAPQVDMKAVQPSPAPRSSLLCTQLTPPPQPDLPEKRHTQPTQESSAQLCDFCLQNDQPTRGLCFKGPDVWSFVMQIFLPADVVLFALSWAPQQETQAVYIFPRCQVRDQKLPTPSVSDRETNTFHLAACQVSHGKGRDLPLSWRLSWQGQQSCKHEPLTH